MPLCPAAMIVSVGLARRIETKRAVGIRVNKHRIQKPARKICKFNDLNLMKTNV